MNRRAFIAKLPALMALAAVPTLGLARNHNTRQGIVTASALNVRSGPGTYYRPIGVVYGGNRVTIRDYANGWYEISSHRVSGWASSSYIRPTDSHDHSRYDDRYDRRDNDYRESGYRESGYVKPPRKFAFIGRNRRGYANMFDGPGRRYSVIARLDEGERVRVIEPGRRWTLVGKRGVGRGYVRSRILETYR